MVNEGYFDLETPFMEGLYEMHHLQIPPQLRSNIEYNVYWSGNLEFVRQPEVRKLHHRIAAFIAARRCVLSYRARSVR
jgi:hypothetical protein